MAPFSWQIFNKYVHVWASSSPVFLWTSYVARTL